MKIKILKYIVFILLACFLFTATAIAIYSNLFPEIEIKTATFCGFDSYDFVVGKIRVRDFSRNHNQQLSFSPKSPSDLISVVHASPYYQENLVIKKLGGHNFNGYVFFCNDNTYLLQETESNQYYFQALFSEFSYDFDADKNTLPIRVYFPCPSNLYFCSFLNQDGTRHISSFNRFFEYYSFEEAKEFYSVYSENSIKINEEEQKIYIRPYEYENKKYALNHHIILDFARKDIGYICDDGAILWVSEFRKASNGN